ncbi:MAG: hypothetical protein J2P50_17325, partial [Hyphomicrobiaceae bacterium]|nr:hypothetical protein [Hyphomicrobiaceae bacterium]
APGRAAPAEAALSRPPCPWPTARQRLHLEVIAEPWHASNGRRHGPLHHAGLMPPLAAAWHGVYSNDRGFRAMDGLAKVTPSAAMTGRAGTRPETRSPSIRQPRPQLWKSSHIDDHGDRIKVYEAASEFKLDVRLPIYARIDGRAFSRFTRGMQRPFDRNLSTAMIATAAGLIERTQARIGYTQSDEISLVFLADAPHSDMLLGGAFRSSQAYWPP